MADQVAVLRGGRLVQLTDPRTLYRQPARPRRRHVRRRGRRPRRRRPRRAGALRAGRAARRAAPPPDGPRPRAAAARAAAAVGARLGAGAVVARVRSVDFYGHDSRVWLDLPDGAAGQRPAGRRRPARGRGRRRGHRARRGAGLPGGAAAASRSQPAPACPPDPRRPARRRGAAGLGKPKLPPWTSSSSPSTPRWGADVVAAGAAGIVVDWERRGKARRQLGEGTQINADTPEDLARMRAATDGRLLCRINGFGPWTAGEVDEAIAARRRRDPAADGAHRRGGRPHARPRRRPLRARHPHRDPGRRRRAPPSSPRRPLSRVYVGLNDLRIDRRSDRAVPAAGRRHRGRRPRRRWPSRSASAG